MQNNQEIMNIRNIKNKILHSVIESLDENDVRNSPVDNYFGWETYTRYLKENRNIITNMNDMNELSFMDKIIDGINANNLSIVDTEDMVMKNVSGICFNKNKQLVFVFNKKLIEIDEDNSESSQ